MKNLTIPTPAATQKSERKAAAADANNRAMFQQTEFGRRRVPSLAIRFIKGILAIPVTLVVFVRCSPHDESRLRARTNKAEFGRR